MPNEITIVVKGDNRSGAAMKQPEDDLEKLRAKAKATGVDLDGLSNEFAHVTEGGDRFGNKLKEGATFSQFLETKLTSLRAETRKLADDFNRTGNTDLLGKLFKNQNAVEELTKLRTRITSELSKGMGDGGRQGMNTFMAELQGTLGTPGIGPIVAGAIIAGVALAAPAVGGALMGAAGIGGIAGGIIGQISDPQVHQAVQTLGVDIMETLSKDTVVFKKPLLQATQEVDQALTKMIGGVDWKAASQDLEPLVRGLMSLVTNILPGFNHLLQESGPVLGSMANDLAEVGKGVSTMFDLIAQGSKGGQEGLRAILYLITGIFVITGSAILGLEKLTEWGVAATDRFGKFLEGVKTGVPAMDSFFETTGRGFQRLAQQLNGANDVNTYVRNLQDMGQAATLSGHDLNQLADQLGVVNDQLSDVASKWTQKLFDKLMGLDEATLHWHESLTKLNDTIGQNGLAIDRHTHLLSQNTKAGEENRAAILEAVQANMAQYQAMINGGISAQDAAQAYDQNTEALKRQLHAAGYTSAQIEDLIGKYERVPDQVNTALAVSGLTDALNNLGQLIAYVNHVDGRQFGFGINVTYSYTNPGRSNALDRAHGGIVGAATGGIRDGLTMVGEQGRELVRLPAGSQVYPHGTTENMLAGPGTRGTDRAASVVRFEGDMDSEFARLFMRFQRDGKIKLYSSAIVAS